MRIGEISTRNSNRMECMDIIIWYNLGWYAARLRTKKYWI